MLQRSNKELLESSLERIARILSDRHDIKVIFSGDNCATEGRTIVLPAIPEECPDDLFDAIQGYLDHEVSHLIFDDFSVINKIRDPFTALWLNAMDDLRDEYQLSQMWRGCKRNLSKASAYALEKKILPNWDGANDFSKLMWASLFYGAGEDYFFDTVPGGDELLKKIEPLKPALELAAQQPDILHSLALACWIIKKLGKEPVLDDLPELKRELLEDLIEEMGSTIREHIALSSGKKDEEGIPADESGGEKSEEGEDSEQEEDSEGDPAEGLEPKEEEEEDGEEESAPGDGELQEEFDVDDDEIEKTKEEIESAKGEAIKDGVASYRHYSVKDKNKFYVPYTTAGDIVEVAPAGNKGKFIEDRKEIRKSCGVMLRRLHSSLVSREKSVVQYDKKWGKLNPRAFARFLNTGYERVFKQESIGETLNCRIALLIDQSGSMSCERKDFEARRAAILFGEFCNQKKIPFEILSFTTRTFQNPFSRFSSATEEDQKNYTRWGDLKITVYKEFHEQWLKVGHRLSHLTGSCHNYDGEAVKIATQRLLLAKKPNERVILFVFSDGLPEQAIRQFQPNHQWYLGKMVEESISRGVECVGIGICTDSVKRYYPNWIVIDDPTQLAQTQLEKLKEVLSFMRKTTRRKRRSA